jgi:cell division protein ZapE
MNLASPTSCVEPRADSAQPPSYLYGLELSKKGYVEDAVQRNALRELDRIWHALIGNETVRPRLAKRLLGAKASPVLGAYLWGDVGRGKTFLMDLFFESLPFTDKKRMHFYHFMAYIHTQLKVVSGKKNPLDHIAKTLAKQCRVLCFDEFFVTDIGDAILIGNLFRALFDQGVSVVTTSNIPIARLFMDELHKHRFDSARALLKQHLKECHLNGDQDHRMRHLSFNQTYFYLGETTPESVFKERAGVDLLNADTLTVQHRPMQVLAHYDRVAWFRFDQVCGGPRAPQDYIELANRFDTVIISDVEHLGGEVKEWIKARGTEDGSGEVTDTNMRQIRYAKLDDPARRFISLVDEFYDRRVNLYLFSDRPMDALYGGGALDFEFARTMSRLTEMQSEEYLSQPVVKAD